MLDIGALSKQCFLSGTPRFVSFPRAEEQILMPMGVLPKHVIFQLKYPCRQFPSHRIFGRILQRLLDTGSLSKLWFLSGRPRSVSSPREEEILILLKYEKTSPLREKLVIFYLENPSRASILRFTILML